MRGQELVILKLVVIVFFMHNSEAVINVTLTGTTVQHVCKGEDIDFKWTYDDNNPDKNDIATIQWSKDPSGYLIMEYETATNNLNITSSPTNYTARVARTTEAGSNDIGMRLKDPGTTAVDDDGKYYVSLIVDKEPGDANDYFVPYRDPQGVQVNVCVGVDDTFPLPSLVLTYAEDSNNLTCTGPSTLGDTTFAIFDPNNNTIVNSTSEVTLEKHLDPNRLVGTYRCKTYCTQQGYDDTPHGTCLPTDAILFLPGPWSDWSSCASPATTRTRNRACDNPPPPDDVTQSCPVVDTETEICPTPPPTQPGQLTSTTTSTQKVTTSNPTPPPTPSTTQSMATVNNGGSTTVKGIVSTKTLSTSTAQSKTQDCECHSGSSKRSINDDMHCGFSGPTFTPCSAEIQGAPNESFISTSAMLPKGPNDLRRRRSASDRASSPGFSFNIIDENNFDMVYFRTNDQNCFEVGSFVNGTFERPVVDNDCGNYRITTDWLDVELHVSDTTVLLKLNHGMIERTLVTKHPFKPSLGFVQGPPYVDECSYDCRFSIRNLSIYPAFEKEDDDMAEMDGFCSSPIKDGCLAMVIVFVILYLMNIYVLILICHTFVKRAHEPIARWLKIILVGVVILVPLIGAILVAVYVYKKHCGVKTTDKPTQEHSGKYFVFTCPCKYLYQPYEVNKDTERGRVSPCSPTPNKVQPDPSHEVHSAPTKPSTAPLNNSPPDKPVISVTPPDNQAVTSSTETGQNTHTGTGGGIGRLPPIEKVSEEDTINTDVSHKKKKRRTMKNKKKREGSYQDNVNPAFENNQEESQQHDDATAYNHKL